MADVKQAACMIVIKDGLILGVSRKHDHAKFGLAGGSVEENESAIKAAIRETKEETDINVYNAAHVYTRTAFPNHLNKNKDIIHVYCFYATSWDGEIQQSEEGQIAWITIKELLSAGAAFPDYNKAAIDELKKRYPNLKLQGEKT